MGGKNYNIELRRRQETSIRIHLDFFFSMGQLFKRKGRNRHQNPNPGQGTCIGTGVLWLWLLRYCGS